MPSGQTPTEPVGDDSSPDLEIILETHRLRLMKMIRGRLQPSIKKLVDAEDVWQEVSLKAHRTIVSLRKKQLDEFIWLCRITRDCLADAYRRHAAQCRDVRREHALPEDSKILLAGHLTSPSGALRKKEYLELIEDALISLSDPYREIIYLKDIDDLTYDEIASLLEITAKNAAVRYKRAWDALNGRLQV